MKDFIEKICLENGIENISIIIEKYPSIHLLEKKYDLEKVLYFFENGKLIYIHKIPTSRLEYNFQKSDYNLSESDESD